MDRATEIQIRFVRKTLRDHLAGIVSLWRVLALAALSVFGVLWTCIEAPAYLLDANLRGPSFYVGIMLVSLIAGLVWTVRSYVNDCPAGLERESSEARRIAQIQKTHWECRLAKQLLQDVLRDLDEELEALYSRRVFVPIEQRLDDAEYFAWVGLGPLNLLRMVGIAENLLVVDFPTALGSPYGAEKPNAIRSAVYRIRDLYADSVTYERFRQSVEPPDWAERLHALQVGWSEPIRDGVRQMYDFLDQVIASDPKSDTHISFSVTMGEPENLDSYNLEMERLSRMIG